MFKIGIDIIEISRIEKSLKNIRFLEKFFGSEERKTLLKDGLDVQNIAGNFCAKEAFSKAIGTGIKDFSMKEVQILKNYLGAPYIELAGRAKFISEKLGFKNFSVSITHTKTTAAAVVLAF